MVIDTIKPLGLIAPMHTQRPDWLRADIRSRFELGKFELTSSSSDPYTYNGDKDDYELRGADGNSPLLASSIIASMATPGKTLRILDIGAGAGSFVLDCLRRGHDAQGISAHDYRRVARFAGSAAQLSDAQYLIGDAQNLDTIPGLQDNYDVVVSNFTFMHFVDPLGALELAADKVAADGMLVIGRGPDYDMSYKTQVPGQYVIDTFQAAGFDTTGSNYDPDILDIRTLLAKRGSAVHPVRFSVAFAADDPYEAFRA